MMDEKNVIKTIRAILLSTKNGLPLHTITEEFYELEGINIPFQQFGFKSLEQFLIESNEFYLKQTIDGPKIIAKQNERSAHVRIFFSL